MDAPLFFLTSVAISSLSPAKSPGERTSNNEVGLVAVQINRKSLCMHCDFMQTTAMKGGGEGPWRDVQKSRLDQHRGVVP